MLLKQDISVVLKLRYDLFELDELKAYALKDISMSNFYTKVVLKQAQLPPNTYW